MVNYKLDIIQYKQEFCIFRNKQSILMKVSFKSISFIPSYLYYITLTLPLQYPYNTLTIPLQYPYTTLTLPLDLTLHYITLHNIILHYIT